MLKNTSIMVAFALVLGFVNIASAQTVVDDDGSGTELISPAFEAALAATVSSGDSESYCLAEVCTQAPDGRGWDCDLCAGPDPFEDCNGEPIYERYGEVCDYLRLQGVELKSGCPNDPPYSCFGAAWPGEQPEVRLISYGGESEEACCDPGNSRHKKRVEILLFLLVLQAGLGTMYLLRIARR